MHIYNIFQTNRFINGESTLFTTVTILDFYTETFLLSDGSYVNVQLLDTGGQETFDAQNRTYYKKADCILLVYDITNIKSFNSCKNYYITQINEECKKHVKVILLGNKTDLSDKREVTKEMGVNLAKNNNLVFMETSCEDNYNVADAFEALIEMTNNDMIKRGKINKKQSDLKNVKKKKNKC